MKALRWYGTNDVRVETVPDPEILYPGDVIIKVTSTAICGSDLHLYDGFMATMEKGDILGHEPMGEVIEVGSQVNNLKKGDRIVVPFTISCGTCYFCEKGLFSLCDTSNPNAEIARKVMGQFFRQATWPLKMLRSILETPSLSGAAGGSDSLQLKAPRCLARDE